jgi:hypothetical protein
MSSSEIEPSQALLPVEAIPSKISRTAVRVLGGEALVLVVDRRELHRLNGVGTRVLELCDGKRSVAAIAEQLASEFEVELDAARADVKRFVAELMALGAVSIGAAT